MCLIIHYPELPQSCKKATADCPRQLPVVTMVTPSYGNEIRYTAVSSQTSNHGLLTHHFLQALQTNGRAQLVDIIICADWVKNIAHGDLKYES